MNQDLRTRATTQVGWILLPLRVFLGVTMVYAGLLKLFDASYLDPNSPNGVQSQMMASATTSPIGPLVSFTADHAALFGLTIAFGELAVGIGVLLGLWTRLAALGGFLLSLSFLLTVSWGVSPYFFGPDIVFMFAFTPLILGGDGGVYSLTTMIRNSIRRKMNLRVPQPASESKSVTAGVDRRAVIRTGGVAVAIGVGALVVGGIGRKVASSNPAAPTAAGGAGMAEPSGAAAVANDGGVPAGGVPIAKSADVAVGSVLAFANPANGDPSYLLQPAAGTYLAYSGICTHQGCTCGFDQPSNTFVCPCHGATFDGSTGDVLRGPAKKPLAPITVMESGGTIYAV